MADDMNSVNIVGNIVRDLEDGKTFGFVGNGTARAIVSIAVNRGKKQADGSWGSDVSYIDVTIWGKTAENLKPYLTKGKKIGVSGFLKQDRWEKDGQKMSRLAVVAEKVQLLSPASNGSQQSGENQQYFQPQQSVPQQNNQPYVQNNFDVQNDGGFPEDIPF